MLAIAATLVACRDRSAPLPPMPGAVPASANALARSLYSAGIVNGTLPLSIRIETFDGASSVVLARGTKLPATFTEIFSTGADGQPSIEVHLVQGERPLAADDRDIGRFQLRGIPVAPRGIPQIDVTVSVDATGTLSVSAIDRATRKSTLIELASGSAAPLDRADLAGALADADAHRADDDRQRARSKFDLDLANLLYSERLLERDQSGNIAPPLRERWQRAMADAEAARTAHDDARLRSAFESLQQVSAEVGKALYTRTAAAAR